MSHNNRGRRRRRTQRGAAPSSTPAPGPVPGIATIGTVFVNVPYETTGVAIADPTAYASIRSSATPVNASYALDSESGSSDYEPPEIPIDRYCHVWGGEVKNQQENMENGVGASALFARLGHGTRLPSREGEDVKLKGDVAVLHVEDSEIWSADVRLQAVSLGFAISVGLPGINARAMYASDSTDSIVDYRFVRLVGLLAKMVPLRWACDKVELREVGTKREYKVYGQVDVPFVAGRWEFKVPCWVVDIAAPVDVVLGHDWLREYQVELMTSLEGQKIVKTRNAGQVGFGRIARDEYVELA